MPCIAARSVLQPAQLPDELSRRLKKQSVHQCVTVLVFANARCLYH